MVKVINRCEKCGEEFEDWTECFDHEVEHVTAVGVSECRAYDPEETECPVVVILNMSNGQRAVYKLDEQATRYLQKNDREQGGQEQETSI